MKRVRYLTLIAAALLFAGASGSGTADEASKPDAEKTGTVVATATVPLLVTPAAAAILRPGQAITVSLSGEVDINQEKKSKRKCGFLGISCKRVSYVDHNFRKPSQLPAVFVLRPRNGGSDLRFTVYDKPVTYQVPTNVDYRATYDLLAALDGAGTTVNGAKSSGAYKVKLGINGAVRANRYALWLEGNPNVDVAISDDVLDQITRSYGMVISSALRNYAKSRYKLSEPINRSAHGKLVTKAYMLAPSDPANSIALADYYTAVGLPDQAREALNHALAQWNEQPQPRSPEAEQQLATAYLKQARAAIEERGGLDEQASLSASAYMEKAAKSFDAGLRPDLAAAARVERARLLRSARSVAGLKEAVVSLETALKALPELKRATTRAMSSDGSAFASLAVRPAVALAPVDRGGVSAGDTIIADTLPVAYDAQEQLFVSTQMTSLQWRRIADPEKVEATVDLSGEPVEAAFAASGRILFLHAPADDRTGSQRIETALKSGAGMVPVTTLERRREPRVTLSADGALAAIGCNYRFATFRFNGAAVQKLRDYDATSLVVAGSTACGFLRLSSNAQSGPMATLDQLNGTSVRLMNSASQAYDPHDLDADGKYAFTDDGRVIALSPTDGLAVFSCATGQREQLIALDEPPHLEVEGDGNYEDDAVLERWTASRLSWAGPRLLAVRQARDTWLGSFKIDGDETARVVLLDWPGGTARSFDAAAAESLWAAGRETILPPAAPGGAPRTFRPASLASAPVERGDPAQPSAPLGGWQPDFRLLVGGNIVLARDGLGTPSLVAPRGPALALGRAGLLSGPLASEDGWFDAEGDATDIRRLRLWKGNRLLGTVDLPGLDAGLRDRVLTDMRSRADSVPIREYTDGRTVAEATLRARYLPGRAVGALAAAGGRASALLCGVPVFQGMREGNETVRFTNSHEQLSLLVAGDTDIGFLNLPPDDTYNCIRVRSVGGAKPGLVRARSVSGTFTKRRLSWWDGTSWVEIKEDYHPEQLADREFPDLAWVRPDGAMLLLTHEKFSDAQRRMEEDPEAGRRYRLQLARRDDGNVADACKECRVLELELAARRWQEAHCPTEAALDLYSVTACGLAEHSDFIRVDATGRYLLLPAGNEMIVVDLSTGAQALRMPFGKPVAIGAEKVTLLLPAEKGSLDKPRLAVFRIQ